MVKPSSFGSTNNYNITWDLTNASKLTLTKKCKEGLDLLDFYPSDALASILRKHKILLQDGGTTIAIGQGTFKDGNGKLLTACHGAK